MTMPDGNTGKRQGRRNNMEESNKLVFVFRAAGRSVTLEQDANGIYRVYEHFKDKDGVVHDFETARVVDMSLAVHAFECEYKKLTDIWQRGIL